MFPHAKYLIDSFNYTSEHRSRRIEYSISHRFKGSMRYTGTIRERPTQASSLSSFLSWLLEHVSTKATILLFSALRPFNGSTWPNNGYYHRLKKVDLISQDFKFTASAFSPAKPPQWLVICFGYLLVLFSDKQPKWGIIETRNGSQKCLFYTPN
jgi:hypothetical protein